MLLTILSSVLLPAPFGPMMPSASPRNLERDVAQRPQLVDRVGCPPPEPPREADDPLSEVGAVAVVLAEAVALADTLQIDHHVAHQMMSAMRRSWRRKWIRPSSSPATRTATIAQRPDGRDAPSRERGAQEAKGTGEGVGVGERLPGLGHQARRVGDWATKSTSCNPNPTTAPTSRYRTIVAPKNSTGPATATRGAAARAGGRRDGPG